MRRDSPVSDVPLGVAVDLFLLRALRPDVYQRDLEPWSRLVCRPSWRLAKPLLLVDSGLVSAVVEAVVGGSLSSHDAAAWMCLGKVRHALGDHAGALGVFEGMLRRDARDIRAHYNAGLCLIALGRAEDARAALERVLEFAPRDVRAARELRAIYAASEAAERVEAMDRILAPPASSADGDGT